MARLKNLFLLFIPAAILLFTTSFVRNQGNFYMNWADPCYAYLLNSSNIADGKLEVGHVDHPGTTVQTLGALIVRTVYTFSGERPVLREDVVANPEKYLKAAMWVLVLLNCTILFFLGRLVLKKTDNLALALFLQSGPLIIFNTLTYLTNLHPEPLLVTGTLLLTMLCFSYIHTENMQPKQEWKFVLKLSLLGGFLVITKITAIPLLIIPFLMLSKWKYRFAFLPGMILTGIVLFIPAMNKADYVFNWISKLIFHSGIYGAGEEKIVDAGHFLEGIQNLFRDDIFFIASFIVCVLLMLRMLFTKKITRSRWKTDPQIRIQTGILIGVFASIIIVAKHFSYHYLIPAYVMMMPAIFIAVRLFLLEENKIAAFFRNKKTQLIIVSVLVLAYSGLNWLKYPYYKNGRDPKFDTAEKMAEYKNVARIYVIYEFPFAEVPPALYFGKAYSGTESVYFSQLLYKEYPRAYFYSFGRRQFEKWGTLIDIADIAEKHETVLVNFYNEDPDVMAAFFKDMASVQAGGFDFTKKKVYGNLLTHDVLYEVNFKKREGIMDNAKVISCDAEIIAGTNFKSTDSASVFQGAECRTEKEFHSGKASMQLSPEAPYGFGYTLRLKKGKNYEIAVWRKSAGREGELSMRALDGKSFARDISEPIDADENGWELLRMRFTATDVQDGLNLKIFTWTANGKGPVYFDDLTIKEY